jgi:hypothetical protein
VKVVSLGGNSGGNTSSDDPDDYLAWGDELMDCIGIKRI